ncbi:FGGY-family carbohydrate kinase [Arsenicicoccus bolidensis]|uniref:Carbohydrate kinase FGGY C-terminal domain-containing protein n=1 Tax=Arsenicicoccus bolidensis TaxID=229480 RepID=A0ABS9Q0C1_9MICO|nr:FGGY-family carbohydrate kinase [Arsenicicoccus bolidensis]MCG7321318.1 hypothetical protein [Arsenicicoccus bolidensis]
MGEIFSALFTTTASAAPDAGGVTAYNYLAGEPITRVEDGRPLVVRTPDSALTLGNLVRAQLYGVFATLRLGMDVLAREGVRIDGLLAHGGVFTTPGVAQSALAAALQVPVTVGQSAAEGGAWGMALLADHRVRGQGRPLAEHLAQEVFVGAETSTVEPDPVLGAGYDRYLQRFVAGLPAVRAAAQADLGS